MPDPFGYGRVIRLVDGSVEKNRRTKKMLANVNLQSMKSIQEFYCFDAEALFASLKKVNKQ